MNPLDALEPLIAPAAISWWPPAPGWCVATSYAPKPTYHDENFTEIVRTVNAGNKALLTSGTPGPAGYPAVLPDHQRGYVSQSEVQIVDCG